MYRGLKHLLLPRSSFAVIRCFNSGTVANHITASKHPFGCFGLVLVEIDVGRAPLGKRQRFRRLSTTHVSSFFVHLRHTTYLAQLVHCLRAKRRDDKVDFDAHKLIFIDHEFAIVVEFGFVKLHRLHMACFVANHLFRRAERHPFAFLFGCCFSLNEKIGEKKNTINFL